MSKLLARLGVDSGQMAWIPTDLPAGKQNLSGPYGDGFVIDVGPGTWEVRIETGVLKSWGKRIFKAYLVGPEARLEELAGFPVGVVVTPTGRVMVTDPCYFHQDGRPEDESGPEGDYYGLACEATLETAQHSGAYSSRLGQAVVTESGCGDGCYPLVHENGIWSVLFIEDDDEDIVVR